MSSAAVTIGNFRVNYSKCSAYSTNIENIYDCAHMHMANYFHKLSTDMFYTSEAQTFYILCQNSNQKHSNIILSSSSLNVSEQPSILGTKILYQGIFSMSSQITGVGAYFSDSGENPQNVL